MSQPPESISAEDAGKLRADAERLRADTEQLRADADRSRIEIEKLRLEVADLRRWKAKAFIAVASAFLAPLITIATFVLTFSASRWMERKRDADALYGKVVQDFATSSVPRRISAISAMEAFTTAQEEEWWNPRPNAERNAANMRARNAISLLVNSLETEANPTVVNALLDATLLRPDLSLTLMKEANRRAAVEFARAAGAYSGLRILRDEKRASMDDDEVPAKLSKAVELGMDQQIARSNQLFDTASDSNTEFMALRFLGGQPYRHFYERQQRYARRDSAHLKSPVPTDSEVNKAEAEMLQKALFLEATSRALVRFLRSPVSATQADRDWHSVAVVCGEFPDRVDFADLDLSNAYLFTSVALNSVSFRKTKLQDADLTGFHFIHGDLEGMEYQDLKLCSRWPSLDTNSIDPKKITWVDKQALQHGETDARCP